MYFGADPNVNYQLAALLANAGNNRNYFGIDAFGADALEADAQAAEMMFSADPTPENAANAGAKRAVANQAKAVGGGQQNMAAMVAAAAQQNLQQQALARAAGKVGFSVTGEDNTAVKTEILPIPATLIAPQAQVTIPVRPTRSMQINSIIFPSLLAATAVCRLTSIQILGLEQLNGPGGVHCSGLTEVRTARVLKGSTAQAGQDILVSIMNTNPVGGNAVTIEGWFEGPDLVRVS